MRVLIVDDETLARSVSVNYLTKLERNIEIREAQNAFEAKAIYTAEPIDLIILDIEMPQQNGIEFLIECNVTCPVIFATAYNEYALQAFELNAVDYLLKPYDFDRFVQAFEKASQIHQPILLNILESLNAKLNKESYLDRLFVKDKDKIHIIKSADIIAIESAGDYCKIITAKSSTMELKSLSEFERELDPSRFVRIHRSTIIQLDEMLEIQVLSSHKLQVTMSNKRCYDVSDSGMKRLKSLQ